MNSPISKSVSKSQFKAKALELFRQIETSGEHIVVTDYGKPTLEVRPYRRANRSPLKVLQGSVVRFDHPTEPVCEEDWEAAK